MNAFAVLLALVAMTSPALAQEAPYALLEGLFGSATDPAASCASNPHQLQIIDNRPHLARTWTTPVDGTAGAPRLREVYDVEGIEGRAMILGAEGLYRADPDGAGRIWVMQFTDSPPGYCWRRPDWPEVRCEDQQLRCEDATS